ncbi:MAG: penicillin acylase family protein, partial [Pseudomonadales bacterium]|nr:penicillin acylase family protein [Pseudomonadales bacterium]
EIRLGEAELGDEQRAAADQVLNWNGELRRDSDPALKYAYFRMALAESLGEDAHRALRDKIDQWYLIVENRTPPPVELSAADQQAIAAAFVKGLDDITGHFGSLDTPYGQVFRVGRDDDSWPVGGGGGDQYGLTTLRTMGYGPPRDDHTRWGTHGQTSTQIIELSTPIKSWIYIPVGQSDRPDSPHYNDQAEKLFSPREMKPSWWRPEDLAGNIESRSEYQYKKGS